MIPAPTPAGGISTVTVCRGETDRLARVIPALASWTDDVHVVETAADAAPSEAVCRGLAHVHHRPLAEAHDFNTARAEALPFVLYDWVLIVDTDETIPAELVAALQGGIEGWAARDVGGVWIARQNWVLDRPLVASSAWPDYQLRLFERSSMTLRPERLHSYVVPPSRTARLPADPALAIIHRNFTSTRQFVDKINDYTSREAAEPGAARPRSPRAAVVGGLREFAARWVKMRGYRDGWEGFHYCALMGFYRYLAIAKAWELDR